jgi:hypothetical protein
MRNKQKEKIKCINCVLKYPPQNKTINVDSPTRAIKMMDKWQTMILERQA